MRKVAFIITKPLQLMVCTSIIDQLEGDFSVHLLITNDFRDAREIFERIQARLNVRRIYKCLFFDANDFAYGYLKANPFDDVYIDSDVGFRQWVKISLIKLKNPATRIYVYEEGVGSYRDDLYENKTILDKFKLHVLRGLGVGTYFGGSCWTTGIYLYETGQHPFLHGNKVIMIRQSVTETIKNHAEFADDIFIVDERVKSAIKMNQGEVVIYLSNWLIDDKLIGELIAMNSQIIVKLHPHIKEDPPSICGVKWVDHSVPAEILIMEAAKYCEKIKVFHHGSSTLRYIVGKNIEFMKM